jgi:anti-anti-sigma factor
MNITEGKAGRYHVLYLSGSSIGMEDRDLLRELLAGLIKKWNAVAVNLSKLAYVNSQFLSQLIMAQRELKKKQGKFAIVGANRSVLDLLRITSTDKAFTLFMDDKALAKTE